MTDKEKDTIKITRPNFKDIEGYFKDEAMHDISMQLYTLNLLIVELMKTIDKRLAAIDDRLYTEL